MWRTTVTFRVSSKFSMSEILAALLPGLTASCNARKPRFLEVQRALVPGFGEERVFVNAGGSREAAQGDVKRET